ncbi:MAG: AbrB/MazE/SpoVT family DNA-binding domain-containing protein [Dehalococcoidia bacterium]|nr:AbrB/MazE/SpoVT family DNA-binding domain-containing protein [Dehalococcoidia bacterium]
MRVILNTKFVVRTATMGMVKVSKKGWAVIPHDIRERYNIQPGEQVQVVDYGGYIAIVPAPENPLRMARGLLKGGSSLTQALLEDRRQER